MIKTINLHQSAFLVVQLCLKQIEDGGQLQSWKIEKFGTAMPLGLRTRSANKISEFLKIQDGDREKSKKYNI